LECTARWLDNGSDPAQAAEEIRLAAAQIKGFIADCDVRRADARQPAAIDKEAPQTDAEALYEAWQTTFANEASKPAASECGCIGKCQDQIGCPSKAWNAAPTVEQDERGAEYGATDFGYTFAGIHLEEGDKRLMAMLVSALGTEHPAIEDLTALLFRAASTSANVAQYQTKLRNPILPECDVWINVSEEGARTAREKYSDVYEVRELFERSANVAQGAEAVAYAAQFDLDVLATNQESHKMRLRRYSHGARTVPLYTAPPAQTALTDAARDVLAERKRQVRAEGWTPEHDDDHTEAEMALAAACYAMAAGGYAKGQTPPIWPWSLSWWKPAYGRRDLIKAGALILAEIERLDRRALTAAQSAS
jgi:hypothetical protein